MGNLKQLQDKIGTNIYPITSSEGVIYEGTTVDQQIDYIINKIDELNSKIEGGVDIETVTTGKNIVTNSNLPSATTSNSSSNTNTYINHAVGGTNTGSIQIKGYGQTMVSANSENVITISTPVISNATTSVSGLMSAADKTKLNGIAANANNYVHPTTAGNKHIPTGGSSGQYLKWSSSGTATWSPISYNDLTNKPTIPTDTKVTSNIASSTYYLCGSTSKVSTTGTLVKQSSVYVDNYSQVFASGGFFESSDERLKDFGERVSVDLDKLSELKKNYFTWKDSENTEQQLGVSAQEIRDLYPEIVSENEDGILSVAYDKLSVITLAAIDELYKKNKELEKRLTTLENKLK